MTNLLKQIFPLVGSGVVYLLLVSVSASAGAQQHPGVNAFNNSDFYGAAESLLPVADEYSLGAFILGELYIRGEGLPQDDYEAIYWLRKAEASGTHHQKLAELQAKHPDVPVELPSLFDFYKSLAQRPESSPQDWYRFGLVNKQGRGASVDRIAAFNWFERASNAGHTFAQIELARLYFEDRQDIKNTTRLIAGAAKSGHPIAQTNYADLLGNKIENGDVSSQRAKWYLKAALQNYGTAQEVMGNLYFLGKHVKQDKIESVKWLILATPKLPSHLQNRSNLKIQLIMKSMSQIEREEAKTRARSFVHQLEDGS